MNNKVATKAVCVLYNFYVYEIRKYEIYYKKYDEVIIKLEWNNQAFGHKITWSG